MTWGQMKQRNSGHNTQKTLFLTTETSSLRSASAFGVWADMCKRAKVAMP